MTPFQKLPGLRRAPAGREWWLLKRLPVIAFVGTVVPIACALLALALAADTRTATGIQIWLLSFLILLCTTLVTVGIGCVIVLIAKGPAYVADAYPLPEKER
jgi:hypothetical protein